MTGKPVTTGAIDNHKGIQAGLYISATQRQKRLTELIEELVLRPS